MPTPNAIVSSFDTGAEGWTIQGDVSSSGWQATGGNPAGCLQWVDAATGQDSYWVAGSQFLGNQEAFSGGALSYDIEDTGSDYSGAPDVELTGGGLTIVATVGQAGTSWTHRSVALTTAANWTVDSLSGAKATQAQIKAVLGGLSQIQIRAEFVNGAESGGLDNVVLAAPGKASRPDVSVIRPTGAAGASGSTPGATGAAGAAGAAAVASNTTSSAANNTAEARGGDGGDGGNGAAAGVDGQGHPLGNGGAAGAGGAGGTAKATVVTTVASLNPVGATATAIGGSGGSAGTQGSPNGAGANGGVGRTATASAQAANADGGAQALAYATGGAGGSGTGAGSAAGNGGVATATATGSSAGAGSVVVGVAQSGGAGGMGYTGANGGKAAASSLANAVTGVTDGGQLTLEQSSTGGEGGCSAGGKAGAAGAGTSTLSFDDTQSATQSAAVFGYSLAKGGTGGTTGTSTPGTAGAAGTATSTITGASAVTANATAIGGQGGTNAAGGKASAATTATGTVVHSDADATGGVGSGTVRSAGAAVATGHATGTSGTMVTAAHSNPGTGPVIQALTASTTGTVDGTVQAESATQFGGSPLAYATADQAIATVTGLPGAAATTAVTSHNAKIAAAFGSAPTFLALGEIGGQHSGGGTASETITETLLLTVDPTRLAGSKDLILGLYHPTETGTGGGLIFDVTVNGTDVVHKTFASLSSATSYFGDHALPSLGSIASFGSTPIQIGVSLSETTAAAGSGLFASLILGTSHL